VQLGLQGNVNKNNWESLSELQIKPGHKLGDASPLFAKVEPEDIEKYKKQLGHTG
jgi:methionyl-tRNA synthetase